MKYDIFFLRIYIVSFVRPLVRSFAVPSSFVCMYMLILSCIPVCEYTHVQFNSYSFGKIMTIYRIKWMAKKCVSSADTGEARSHTHHTSPPTGCPIDTISPTTDRMGIGRKRTARRTDEKNARKNVHLRWIQNIHTYAYYIKYINQVCVHRTLVQHEGNRCRMCFVDFSANGMGL